MPLHVRITRFVRRHSLPPPALLALAALALPGVARAQATCPPDTVRAMDDGWSNRLFQWEFSGSMSEQLIILGTPLNASGVQFSSNLPDGTSSVGVLSGAVLIGLRLSTADRFMVEAVGNPGPERVSLVGHLQVRLLVDSYFYHGVDIQPRGVAHVRLVSPAGDETRDVVITGPPSSSEFELIGASFDVTVGEPFEIRTILWLERSLGSVGLSAHLSLGAGEAGTFRISACSGNSVAVPVQPTTWGALKALYR